MIFGPGLYLCSMINNHSLKPIDPEVHCREPRRFAPQLGLVLRK